MAARIEKGWVINAIKGKKAPKMNDRGLGRLKKEGPGAGPARFGESADRSAGQPLGPR